MKNFLRRFSASPGGAEISPAAHTDSAAEAANHVESALAHHRAGRLADAELLYRKALAIDGDNFDALHMLGVVHQQTGRSTKAVELLEQATAVAPENAFAHSNLGLAYQSLNQLDDAAASLRKALALQPDWDGAHNSLGAVLRAAGRPDDAEACFRRAVELNPSNAGALSNLGNICRESGQLDEALDCFRTVLELQPDDASALAAVGSIHALRAELAHAEDCFRRALQIDANGFDAICNLADVLRRRGSLGEAESFARKALTIRPDDPDALNTLACILLRNSALDEAEACCRSALAIRSEDAPTQVTLGNILNARQRLPEAEACFRAALRLRPHLATARCNLSMLRMLQGDYGEGLELYESRFDALLEDLGMTPAIREHLNDDRRWRGEDLRGRRLLVWTEQGFGDSLMALRYLPMLKARGAGDIIVLCERELTRVVRSVSGLGSDVESAQSVPADAFDLHCPIMSLPLLFYAQGGIPGHVPYIEVPDELANAWRERLSSPAKWNVGLAWAGSNSLHDDRRSIPLTAFEPVIKSTAVQLVSLQKGDGVEQVGAWRGQIEDWMDDCDDFLDTAALVGNLDLVISIDSAIAHLAGALGKPVWLLNRYGSDWRWGLESERCPWYPSMRIFRQRRATGWDGVFAQVADALAHFQPSRALRS